MALRVVSLHRASSTAVGGKADHVTDMAGSTRLTPNVWSGRALQEGFIELAVGGLASMYPASGWGSLLRAIMEISAPAISLPDRPQRAIWVTSARTRREDRSSISFHPLADLGG